MHVEKGTRVRLIRCNDQYTKLRPGEKGTVSCIDALGTVHVHWDSGSRLGLIPNDDEFDIDLVQNPN